MHELLAAVPKTALPLWFAVAGQCYPLPLLRLQSCTCTQPSPRVVLVVLRLRLRLNLSLLGELLLVMQPAHGVAKTSRDGCRNSAWMLAGLAALHGGAVVVSGACAALKLWLGLLKVISSRMPWCLLPV